MPDRSPATSRRGANPSFLKTARALYGAAFDSNLPDDVREASSDWSALTDAQRSYALAHLLYLNLHAQQTTHRLLAELCDSNEELVDALGSLTRAGLRDPARLGALDQPQLPTSQVNTEAMAPGIDPAEVPQPDPQEDETSLAALFNVPDVEVGDENG